MRSKDTITRYILWQKSNEITKVPSMNIVLWWAVIIHAEVWPWKPRKL